jgi:alkyl sulfatase BDS1-like metallo-beta-lactamase superfamily hydrolase
VAASEEANMARWLGLAMALLAASPAAAQGTPSLTDSQDVAFADRGFVATRGDPLIKAADGRTVWDLRAYDFLRGPAPATPTR